MSKLEKTLVTNDTEVVQVYYDADGSAVHIEPGKSAVLSKIVFVDADVAEDTNEVAELRQRLNSTETQLKTAGETIKELRRQIRALEKENRRLSSAITTAKNRVSKKAATK